MVWITCLVSLKTLPKLATFPQLNIFCKTVMLHKSPAKILRSIKRIAQFLSKKSTSTKIVPYNKISKKNLLTKTLTLSTTYTDPCSNCKKHQCNCPAWSAIFGPIIDEAFEKHTKEISTIFEKNFTESFKLNLFPDKKPPD